MDNQNFNQQTPYQQWGYQYPPTGNQQGGGGLGIASMVLGIVALVLSCCFYYISIPCAILGVIFGGVSISKKKPGRGMAIAGLVCSIVSLVPAIIIIISGASLLELF